MTVVELIGVYDADGGLLGEAAYVWGKIRGTRHCALCDITHSPIRRKPAWDRFVAELGLPFWLRHLNELAADESAAVAAAGAPVVLARLSDGTLTPLLRADDLDSCAGSIDHLGTLLHPHL